MKRPFYFDGAFGTYYSEQYGDDIPCELANLRYPERVSDIHKAYLAVGVDAIKTNTFGVNSSWIEEETLCCELLTAGYRIAREVTAGTNVQVFCDIGYIDGENQLSEYQRNVDVFLSLGGKNFVFETLQEFSPLDQVISYLKEKEPTAKVLVSFSVSQDGYTKKGYYYETLLKEANQYADVVGLNCQCGPSHLYSLIERLNLSEYKQFSAMPNAGYPQAINGRTVYSNNKEYYAKKLLEIASLGVNIVGGCCGTTPGHLAPVIGQQLIEGKTNVIIEKAEHSVQKNQLLELFSQGKKVLAVEIDPPVDTHAEFLMEASHQMKTAGVDLITVADSPLARTRADSMMLAAKVKREVNIDVLPHLSCRDKNYIAIRSLLIGANIEGVNNVLVVTGDPISRSDGGVFQFNSYTLMNLVSNLNREVFYENPYTVCGALNVNALHFDTEIKRARQKLKSGVSVLFTQPIFSENAVRNFIKAKEELDCYLMAGILPIAGWKNALFLNNEVSGIEIPRELIDKLQVMTPDEVRDAVVSYSMERIRRVYDHADGFYIMTPLRKTELVSDIVANIRKMEQEEA
ncbi:MAG: bifunctional homocysteine S-methyltransferase/methylenetetrahydrofolate reductase [Clostridia bacterium]|nr:bifunctional homocysteine S-methyltransferase/methylenetetrahydrofolate reductase [Clostridia bacterium]